MLCATSLCGELLRLQGDNEDVLGVIGVCLWVALHAKSEASPRAAKAAEPIRVPNAIYCAQAMLLLLFMYEATRAAAAGEIMRDPELVARVPSHYRSIAALGRERHR